MLKETKNEDTADTCFVCHRKFKDGDEVVTIFDKAFGGVVNMHQHHHFDGRVAQALFTYKSM